MSSRVAILDQGRLKFEGVLQELVNLIDMSVWVGACELEENALLKEQHIVVKQGLSGDYWS